MKVHRNTKQILGNWLYNLGGIAIMNAVLQFFIETTYGFKTARKNALPASFYCKLTASFWTG